MSEHSCEQSQRGSYCPLHKIEDVFGRIKERYRFATGYNACAHTVMSAIAIAATCCYWN